MSVTMARTAWTDDDGTGTTGTVINNAEKSSLYNQIDAALAQVAQTGGVGDFSRVGVNTSGQLFSGNREIAVSGGVTGDVIGDVVAQGARTTDTAVARFVGMSKTNAVASMDVIRSGADNSGDLAFNTMEAGASTEKMRISKHGWLQLAVYTGTTWATGDKYLVIDATGNVHRSAIGPAS